MRGGYLVALYRLAQDAFSCLELGECDVKGLGSRLLYGLHSELSARPEAPP